MKEKDLIKLKLLKEEFELLKSSIVTLSLSLDKCKLIGKRSEYSFEEMESFDSLTSKFGRTSDVYTHKVLRTIWDLLHEPPVPFIDMLNRFEKLNIVFSAEDMLEARDLRNQITHEYIPEAIVDLVPEVIDSCVSLLNNIEHTEKFLRKRDWL